MLLQVHHINERLTADVTWGRPVQVPVWWKETHGAGSRSATSHWLYLSERKTIISSDILFYSAVTCTCDSTCACLIQHEYKSSLGETPCLWPYLWLYLYLYHTCDCTCVCTSVCTCVRHTFDLYLKMFMLLSLQNFFNNKKFSPSWSTN